ncbi:MAG: LysR family transcriptional regulator, partial [Betaproteobacteria bacterium]|nr:LysR family transcriptional regulator [Betaproteobacteria bacterium]
MDKLRAMAAFVRIVDAGSLTAAADTLDVSQPSMVRTLAALEEAVGVRLINRTTRRMALTDEGREYYERCKLVLAAVDEAEASLTARRTEPRGRMRITSSVTFGRALLAPLVIDFMAAHPQLRVELMLLDRVIDLVEEGIDVGVRLAHLPDSSLVAVPVGETRRVV